MMDDGTQAFTIMSSLSARKNNENEKEHKQSKF